MTVIKKSGVVVGIAQNESGNSMAGIEFSIHGGVIASAAGQLNGLAQQFCRSARGC